MKHQHGAPYGASVRVIKDSKAQPLSPLPTPPPSSNAIYFGVGLTLQPLKDSCTSIHPRASSGARGGGHGVVFAESGQLEGPTGVSDLWKKGKESNMPTRCHTATPSPSKDSCSGSSPELVPKQFWLVFLLRETFSKISQDVSEGAYVMV